MFKNCGSLTTAPAELPAKTLAKNCYESMFAFCSSLTFAPAKLPAEALAENCYESMFAECTSLQVAPELPVKTLADGCYREMFYGCTNLTSVTMLATDVSADMCLENWLNEAGTNNQGIAPTLTLYNSDVYNKILEQNNNGFHYLPGIWSYDIRYKYY